MGELIRGEWKILRLATEGSQGFLVRWLPQKPPLMDTRRHCSSGGTHQTDVMNQTTFPRALQLRHILYLFFILGRRGRGKNVFQLNHRDSGEES